MAGVLYFGNTRIAPAWAGDFGNREHILPQPGKLDPSQFTDASGVQVSVAAAAAQNATSITINALQPSLLANTILIAQGNTLIPSGTTLNLGLGKYATLTAAAIVGATSLTVQPLVTALTGNETAVYSKFGVELIPSGTLVGRYNPARNSSGLYVPAVVGMDEIYLTMFDIPNANLYNDVEFYRHYSLVKENYLPNYAAMTGDTGLASPSTAPTLSVAGTDGSAGAGEYQVAYTFINGAGETEMSPISTIVKTTTQHIAIASIAFPSGATGINYYCSTAPGSGEIGFSKTLSSAAATNLTADGTAGHVPPSLNTTVGLYGIQLQLIRQLYTCIQGVN
jgi:hypothetical protein